MNAHLEAIPGLGTLTARGLTGSDGQTLGGQTDGTLGAKVLVLGSVDDLRADLLENLDLAGGQGDTDLVALLQSECQSIIQVKSSQVFLYFPLLRKGERKSSKGRHKKI